MWRPVRFVKIIPELSRKKRHRLRLESGVCLSWLRLSSCWQPSELQGLDHCLFISPPRSAADPCSHILLSRTLTSARNCRNQEMMNNCQPLKEFLASSSTAVRGYHWYMLGNFSMFYTEHLPTLSCPQGFLRSWLIDFLTQTKKKNPLFNWRGLICKNPNQEEKQKNSGVNRSFVEVEDNQQNAFKPN